MALQAGTRLGPYEVVALLGEGGMGEVYRARDTRLDRDVAIKTLPARVAADADRLARFEREARAASSLNHPNILHIYDVGTAGGTPYLAMELVDGETLRGRMVKGLDSDAAVTWMAQVAEALGKAHAAGIIHRDLKPENIMISRDGYVKVLDFGLAKLVAAEDSACNVETRIGDSRPGLIVGTVGYMSPEQALAGAVDRRSDVFSFGCILHEMLSGRSPFGGATDIDRLHNLVHGDPAPLPVNVTSSLRQIVGRCLQKDPAGRYDSMAEIVTELRSAGRGGALVASTPEASRSIAVLPFDDLSPAKDSEYLGAGVAEEIITDFSAIEAMRVVARASAAAAKGTGQSVPAIARILGVQYVVTGSVRRAGDRLRIAAQLVDASRDVTLWAQKFDGTMDDIFDIQESVARAIAAQLRLEISSGESGRLRRRPVVNVRAYECYLRARNEIYKFTRTALDGAIREVDRAIDLEGPNALLYATKGMIEWQYFNIGAIQDRAVLDRAEALAKRSQAIDPHSAKAEAVLGLVAVHRPDLRAAVRHLEGALARDASEADAAGWLLVVHVLQGRNEQAGILVDRLSVLDPIAPFTMLGRLVLTYMEGRFEQALEHLARFPDKGPFELAFQVQLLLFLRRFEEAAALSDTLLQTAPDDPFVRMAGMMRFAAAGNRQRVEELLTEPLRAAARNDLQYSAWIAEAFALLGDTAQSVDWLRHAMSRGFLAYPFTATHDWFFDRIRGDAAFQSALEDMRTGWLEAGRPAT